MFFSIYFVYSDNLFESTFSVSSSTIDEKKSYIFKGCSEEPLYGIVKYINQELLDLGVNEGDEISFQPDSEYPFTIEEEKLYRMFTHNITMLV